MSAEHGHDEAVGEPEDERLGWRQRFRYWRATRPFWAGLITMFAGLWLIWSPQVAIGGLAMTIGIVTDGWLIGALLIILAVGMWLQPQVRGLAGAMIIVLSLGSFIKINFGGFLIGMLAGLVGGAMAIAWTPDVSQDDLADEDEEHEVAEPSDQLIPMADYREDRQGVISAAEPITESVDDPIEPVPSDPAPSDPAPSDPAPWDPAPSSPAPWDPAPPERSPEQAPFTPPLTPAPRPAEPHSAPRPAEPHPAPRPAEPPARPSDVASAPMRRPPSSPPAAPATEPTPARPVWPASDSNGDHGPRDAGRTTIGLSGAVAIVSVLAAVVVLAASSIAVGQDGTPTPSPSPTPSEPASPTPTPTPTAPPSPTASPTATPSTSPAPKPSPTGEPSPASTPPNQIRAAAEEPHPAGMTGRLTADSSTMSGLQFDGVVTYQDTPHGTVRALRLSAERNELNDMTLRITIGGITTTISDGDNATSVLAGSVVLDVTRIAGNLDGVPVEFTPDSPPPQVVSPMVLTELSVDLLLVQADRLMVPGMNQVTQLS